MKSLLPYLYFDGNAEEAFEFYKSVFGGEYAAVIRYREMGDGGNFSEEQLDMIAHIALPLGDGLLLMASDRIGSGGHSAGNNVHLMLQPESAEEARRVFDALAAGGKVGMGLQGTEWAELHGNCTDKFGIHWMFDYTGDVEYQPQQ